MWAAARSVPVLVPESGQFAARLRKVARQRRKWAKREGVSCYRIYDADLPDYAASIDLYEGAGDRDRPLARHLRIRGAQVHRRLARPGALHGHPDPRPARARRRRRARRRARTGPAPAAGPSTHRVARPQRAAFARSRRRQAVGQAGRRQPVPALLIEEGGLTFEVNFDDYLDTGIFLDHRVTRGLVREHAKQARYFLNLFAYTGTATCYAADAGVEETVTVDLSNTYLDWAERNMERSGFTGHNHYFVRDDVLAWIRDQRQTRNRWDLIFCDLPPSPTLEDGPAHLGRPARSTSTARRGLAPAHARRRGHLRR
ncbi:MAG: class I SAM-dependent methyltransferase [Collinsella sp.]